MSEKGSHGLNPARPSAATKEIEQEITEGTEKEIDAGTDSKRIGRSVIFVYSCSTFSFVFPSARQGKKYGKKM
jgi:hypothetical protein